ncbi:MAG: rod shape-determining protein RodA [Planctomycetes bacterium]|nr:rod shape-determining protein RodA [Planctomycetota bacterium]
MVPDALTRLPWTMMILLALVLGIGLSAIADAVPDSGDLGFWRTFHGKQTLFTFLGWAAFAVVLGIHYFSLRPPAYLLYGLGVVGLLGLLLVGQIQYGARRWIPLGPFHLQPAEPMKLFTVVALARRLCATRELLHPLGLIPPLLMTALPMGLILLQPDLGTALVFLPVLLVMLFAAGADPRQLGLILLALAIAVAVLFSPLGHGLLHDYQRKRLTAFLHPEQVDLEEGYQLIRARVAIGSGGAWGKWWDETAETNFRTVPIRQNDFIFTVLAEQYGFAGASLFLLLYFLMLLACLRIAAHTREPFGRLLVVGLTTSIAVQFLVNVAMTMQLVPTTGITLPFVSYGGSSLLSCMAGMGLIANVATRRVPSFAARDFEEETGEIRALGPRAGAESE